MTTETLKELISIEFERSETISQFKESVLRLIDLYEKDREYPTGFYPSQLIPGEPEMIPYSNICPCNPANGGSGTCGCTMGNTMIKNPKKF
jgi:hypothetical protein